MQRRLVGLQGNDDLLAAGQARQLRLGPLCEGHDLLDGAAVLPLQGEDHAQTLLDLSEPLGVVLDAIAVGPQRRAQLLELQPCGLGHLAERRHRRIEVPKLG